MRKIRLKKKNREMSLKSLYQIAHTYNNPGTKIVRYRMTDKRGNTRETSAEIRIVD